MSYKLKLILSILFVFLVNKKLIAEEYDITFEGSEFPNHSTYIDKTHMGGIAGEIVTMALTKNKITYNLSFVP